MLFDWKTGASFISIYGCFLEHSVYSNSKRIQYKQIWQNVNILETDRYFLKNDHRSNNVELRRDTF